MADTPIRAEAAKQHRATASSRTGAVTIEVGADGAIHGIDLSDTGQRLPAERVAMLIAALHERALAAARAMVDEATRASEMAATPERFDENASPRDGVIGSPLEPDPAPVAHDSSLDDLEDEDEYYRGFVIVHEDDHRPRRGR
ncbi:hypothetical protein GZH49_22865 [Nocardia terpenica]|uniref:hypothetical protein n=1 Tax=Nocardia terpenica TaxID=455432 RepID=UPI002FDF9689